MAERNTNFTVGQTLEVVELTSLGVGEKLTIVAVREQLTPFEVKRTLISLAVEDLTSMEVMTRIELTEGHEKN